MVDIEHNTRQDEKAWFTRKRQYKYIDKLSTDHTNIPSLAVTSDCKN